MFAHASGFSWDEALLVMIPIAAGVGVLFLANARAKRLPPDPEPVSETAGPVDSGEPADQSPDS